jgi:hypothetical protein
VRHYLLPALRRFVLLLAAVVSVTAVISLLVGLAGGGSLNRALSLGFYIVGSFLLVAGFFVGNRGPARLKGEAAATPIFGERFVRWATPREREETLNDSAIFVAIGFALILLGAAVDTRHRLF